MTAPRRGEPISRVAFLGTPQLAVTVLDRLVESDIEVITVVTAAPTRRGRGSAQHSTPVASAAERLGIEVAHDPAAIINSRAQAAVVVAYGHMIRPPVLGSMPLVNLHFSTLPRWRGAAPVERAMLAGDATAGVCVMEIEAGLDTGGVYASTEVDIGEKTLHELWQELAEVGADLLIGELRDGLSIPRAQVGEVTHAAKLTKAERCIDPTAEPASMLCRRVRLGGAWTMLRGERLGVVSCVDATATATPRVANGSAGEWIDGTQFCCADGSVLELVEVRPAGRRVMSAEEWARGVRLSPGDILGSGGSSVGDVDA